MLPFILAGLALSAAGTAANLVAGKQAADAQEEELRRRARQQKEAAADAVKRGIYEAGRARFAATLLAAEQRSVLAESPLQAVPGQQHEAVSNAMVAAETDIEMLRNNAFREAWGLETEAKILRRRADQTAAAVPWQLAGTALSGLGQTAGMAYDYFKTPAPKGTA